jgi:hypothetical protein
LALQPTVIDLTLDGGAVHAMAALAIT